MFVRAKHGILTAFVRIVPSYTAKVTHIPNMVAEHIVAHRVIHLIQHKQMVAPDARQVQHSVHLAKFV